jgi:hypothetical protein
MGVAFQQSKELRLGNDGNAQQGGAALLLLGDMLGSADDEVGRVRLEIAGDAAACLFDGIPQIGAGDFMGLAGEDKGFADKGLRDGGGIRNG